MQLEDVLLHNFFFILNGMLMTIHIVGCILSQWITTQPTGVTQVLWCFWSGPEGFQSQFTLDVFQVSITAETGTNSVRCCQLSRAVFLFLCSFKSTPHIGICVCFWDWPRLLKINLNGHQKPSPAERLKTWQPILQHSILPQSQMSSPELGSVAS